MIKKIEDITLNFNTLFKNKIKKFQIIKFYIFFLIIFKNLFTTY